MSGWFYCLFIVILYFCTSKHENISAMIKSMTGYGKAEAILETGKITVEVRSLNGKTADISLKTSMQLRGMRSS